MIRFESTKPKPSAPVPQQTSRKDESAKPDKKPVFSDHASI